MVEGQPPRVDKKKKKIALAIFAFVLIAGLVTIFFYNRYINTHISTDDAFIESDIYTISPRVAGTVKNVLIKDNSPVRSGDLLVELDPEVYSETEKEASSSAETEKRRVSEIEAAISAQDRKVAAAEAAYNRTVSENDELKASLKAKEADVNVKKALLNQAGLDLKRAEELIKNEVLPQASYDRAKTAFDTALSNLQSSEEVLKEAEAALKTHGSREAESKAMLDSERANRERLKASLKTQNELIKARAAGARLAGINLSYTKIYAPADGYVTRKNVEPGNHVEAGQPLMAVVALKGVYIIANYKETRVHVIKPGQKVDISVDTYPDRVFKGHVESIMAGTGSAFSLFPPENATGNYVKVVQRVPVKILIDEGIDSEHILRVGMSVVPTVLVE